MRHRSSTPNVPAHPRERQPGRTDDGDRRGRRVGPLRARRSSRRRARSPRRVRRMHPARASPGRGRAVSSARRGHPDPARRHHRHHPGRTTPTQPSAPGTHPKGTGLAAPGPVVSRAVGDSMNTTWLRRDADVVLPGGPLQLHRLGAPQRPGRIPFADAQEDALPILELRRPPRRLPSSTPKRTRPPSAASRCTCEAMGTVSPPANSCGSKKREYCDGIPALGQGEDRPGMPEDAGVGLRLLALVPHRPAVPDLHGVQGAGHLRVLAPPSSSALRTARPDPTPAPAAPPPPPHDPTATPAPPGRASLAGQEAASPTWGGAAPHWCRSRRPPIIPRHRANTHAADQPTCVWQSRGMPTLSEDLAFRGLIHQMTDVDLPKRLDQPRAHGLRRLRPVGRQPPCRQPDAAVHVAPFPECRPHDDLPGRRGHRHDRRPRRQAGRAPAARPARRSRATCRGSGPNSPSSSTWPMAAASCSTMRTGWAASRPWSTCATWASTSPSTRWWPRSPSRAASNARIRASPTPSSATCCCRRTTSCASTSTTAATCSSVAATSGATSPWASTTSAKVCGDEVWGFTTPLIVKADGTKYGKTESGTVWLDPQRTSPFTMYQFFLNTPDEQVVRADQVPDLPEPRPHHRARARHGGGAPASRGAAGAGPGRHRARARRRRGGQVRGGFGGAVRRGDRRAQRGDAPGRDRGCAVHRGAADGAPRQPHPRRTARAHGSGQVQEGSAPDRSIRAGPTSTTSGRPTTGARSGRVISCTTGTSCCARVAKRSTSSRPDEASVSRPVPRAHSRMRIDPHLVCRCGPGRFGRAEHVGLDQGHFPR